MPIITVLRNILGDQFDRIQNAWMLTPYDLGTLTTTTGDKINCHQCTCVVLLKMRPQEYVYVLLYADKDAQVISSGGRPSFMQENMSNGHHHHVRRDRMDYLFAE